MKFEEFNQLVSKEDIVEVPEGGAFFVFSKMGSEINVSYEGQREEMISCFVALMKKFYDVDDILNASVEMFQNYENGESE